MGTSKVEGIREPKEGAGKVRQGVRCPCVICGGTTDIDLFGYIYCESCDAMWTIFGEHVKESDWLIRQIKQAINSKAV